MTTQEAENLLAAQLAEDKIVEKGGDPDAPMTPCPPSENDSDSP
jgi:hypothetical protein